MRNETANAQEIRKYSSKNVSTSKNAINISFDFLFASNHMITRCHFNRFDCKMHTSKQILNRVERGREREKVYKKFIDNPSHFCRSARTRSTFFLLLMNLLLMVVVNENITHLIEFLPIEQIVRVRYPQSQLQLDLKEHRIRLISQLCLIKCRLIESLPNSSSVPFELR